MKHFTIVLFFYSICLQSYGQSIDLLGYWTGMRLQSGVPYSISISLDFRNSDIMLHYEKERMSAIETEMRWHLEDNRLLLINSATNEQKEGLIVQQKENFLVFKFNTDSTAYFYAIYRTDDRKRYKEINIHFPKNLKSADIKSNIDAENIPDLNISIIDSLNVLTNSDCTQFNLPLSFRQIGSQLFAFNRSFFLQVIASDEYSIQLNDIANEAIYTFSNEIITNKDKYEILSGKWQFSRKLPKTGVRTIKVGRLSEEIHFNKDGTGIYFHNEQPHRIRWLLDSNNRIHIIVRTNETSNTLPPNDPTFNFNGPLLGNFSSYYQFDIEELNDETCTFREANCDGLNFFYGKRLE